MRVFLQVLVLTILVVTVVELYKLVVYLDAPFGWNLTSYLPLILVDLAQATEQNS
jgi:hypothetical protein